LSGDSQLTYAMFGDNHIHSGVGRHPTITTDL